MTRVAPLAPPDPGEPAEARPLTPEEHAERIKQDARKRDLLQRRKAAGYGVPGGLPNTITK